MTTQVVGDVLATLLFVAKLLLLGKLVGILIRQRRQR